jgi:hypothetical protein
MYAHLLSVTMSHIYQIQSAIFCEPCKECGARPVLKLEKLQYTVMCPNNSNHYRTKPGLADVNDWNLKNKVQKAFEKEASVQKAS